MKKQIKIIKHENKTSQGGKDYTRFQTSDGWMSAFDDDIIKDLKEAEGRNVSVEIAVAEKGDRTFSNIRKFYGIVAPGLENLQIDEAIKESDELIEMAKPKDFNKKGCDKDWDKGIIKKNYTPSSMFVSYAKDIFISMSEVQNGTPEERMSKAIELVKQAEKAFS